jgi:hypothetical protein
MLVTSDSWIANQTMNVKYSLPTAVIMRRLYQQKRFCPRFILDSRTIGGATPDVVFPAASILSLEICSRHNFITHGFRGEDHAG